MFKMLTGQRFEISYLLGFPLSSGTTRAVFDKSAEIFCSILEFIDLNKSGVKKSTATLISFGEMVSIPVVFLKFNPCISFFYFRFIVQNGNKTFRLHEIKISIYFLFAIY